MNTTSQGMTKGVEKGSTWFLRLVISVMGLGALAICIFAVPSMGKGIVAEFPAIGMHWQYLIMFGLYATAIPYFNALYQTMKLLNYIDANNAFSELSVSALKKIKYSGIIMSIILIGLFEPLAFFIAEADDAPGLIIFAMAAFCIPIAVAVFAAVLHRLMRNAIDMKSENELTV